MSIFESIKRLKMLAEENKRLSESRLSDALVLSPTGEVSPRHDIRGIFDEMYSNPFELSYEKYERWCKLSGREPDPRRWAAGHGVYSVDENEPDGAA